MEHLLQSIIQWLVGTPEILEHPETRAFQAENAHVELREERNHLKY